MEQVVEEVLEEMEEEMQEVTRKTKTVQNILQSQVHISSYINLLLVDFCEMPARLGSKMERLKDENGQGRDSGEQAS